MARFESHREFLVQNVYRIEEILRALHGQPTHGNKADPLDELVYIMLSRKTRESGSETAFNRLKERFPRWGDLLLAAPAELEKAISTAGLGRIRTRALLNNLRRIKKEFGRVTLDPLRSWPDNKVFEWLTSLDGVGPKSANCVMMYSLGRSAFPVDTHVRRVSARLGFVSLELDHKEAQANLAESFPKELRKSLHITMVSHGRQICRPKNPRCEACPLSGFCLWYRTKRIQSSDTRRPTAVDLFSGSGAGSEGLTQAGYRVALAIDSSPAAASSYYLNRPESEPRDVWCGDVRRFTTGHMRRLRRVDLIFAGLPCQPFSMVGKRIRRAERKQPDRRRHLYKQVLRLTHGLRPKAVVIENVKGLATAEGGSLLGRLRKGLAAEGFMSETFATDATSLGVPQKRPRLLIIALRVTRGTHSMMARKVFEDLRERLTTETGPPPSLRDGTWDLPRLGPGEGGFSIPAPANSAPPSAYAFRLRNGWSLVFNHQARFHNDDDLELYRLLQEGETAREAIEKYRRPDLMRYGLEGFTDKYRKLVAGKPSPTVVAHLAKDANMFVHPRDNRGLTVREAARIQGIPDDFVFLGSLCQQFDQVGNAVPPQIVAEVARALLPWMAK